ncbi:putative riboflavin kinase [Tribonema minus]|uniref:riboflavin kinase n=1 Tax=Tribonema minus TaxID=303371 RepID=A0A836CCA6_9STRA|nr:putative riboflavin kinase [Tribonema minus]
MSSKVIKGFGRGSKLLGIPTANMCMKEVGHTADPMETGIYCGFARLGDVVYKAVVSIGWNPYFDNKEKTVEPHLLHDFGDNDFYGETLHLRICSYIRPEMNFVSLDDLIRAIHGDIAYAHQKLAEPEMLQAGQALRDLDTGAAAAATPGAAATAPAVAPTAEDQAADEDGGDA